MLPALSVVAALSSRFAHVIPRAVFPVLKMKPLLLSTVRPYGNLFAYPHFPILLSRSIKSGLTRSEVEEKVLAVCSAFDKIDSSKLSLDSNFLKDLGLDSLDHIEVIMEIENEFWFEISDVDAEKLLTPRDVVEHVCQTMDRALPVQ